MPKNQSLAATNAVSFVGLICSNNFSSNTRLAALTLLQTQVVQAGEIVLATEAQKIGRFVDWFDKITPYAVAESETVAPGSTYRARLFLWDTNLHYCTTVAVQANGQNVTPRYSEAAFRFKVPPVIIANESLAYWQGTIQALANPELHPYAADTTWTLNVPYHIIKSVEK